MVLAMGLSCWPVLRKCWNRTGVVAVGLVLLQDVESVMRAFREHSESVRP